MELSGPGASRSLPGSQQVHRIRRLISASQRASGRLRLTVAALIVLAVLSVFQLVTLGVAVERLHPGLAAILAVVVLVGIGTVLPTVLRHGLSQYRNLDRLLKINQRLESRIEQFEDLRWTFQEEADRLQALLDGQQDIIIRRDPKNRITFVNRAFTKVFNLPPSEVLGELFNPTILSSVHAAGSKHDDGEIQLVETATGPCWIAWSHSRITDPATGRQDLQSVGRDVTAQRHHEQELADARDEAQAANRAKSRFLASMSHEIRTPMNGILGMTALLAETEQTPEQQTYGRAIDQSARKLLALIDEILDFSKIEAGRLELRAEPTDIAECVQGVVELLAPRAYEKQLELAWMIERDTPSHLLVDPNRLHQILLNLIGNAIKFTVRGGVTVRVSSRAAANDSRELCIAVRDTGVGLTNEAIDRVFNEFERAPVRSSDHEGGTGLGLAIARRVAHKMGGDITVSSEPGRGAVFSLVLPLNAVTPRLAMSPSLAGRRIVLVSANLLERATIADLLRSHGAVVDEMNSAESLIDDGSVHQTAYDAALFDVEEDFTVTGQAMLMLRNKCPAVRGFVLAATGSRAEIQSFRRVGIEKFLVRPIRPQSILAQLASEPESSSIVRGSSAAPQVVSLEQASVDLHKLRILVAEDNDINALLAQRVLARLSCEAHMATNGREAVELMSEAIEGRIAPFDVVLMDLHMPELDGFAAARIIGEQCAAANVERPAIVAVTANAFSEDRHRCLAAGMDGYLSKPFEPADLERTLVDVVCKRRAA